MMFRSWLRLRCGLLVLSHLDGRRSAARFQLCIFCGSWIRNPMVHCLSKCPHWNSHRDGICLCLGTVESMGCQQFALQCLRSSIPSKALGLVVKWSSCIDRAEFEYWKLSLGWLVQNMCICMNRASSQGFSADALCRSLGLCGPPQFSSFPALRTATKGGCDLPRADLFPCGTIFSLRCVRFENGTWAGRAHPPWCSFLVSPLDSCLPLCGVIV